MLDPSTITTEERKENIEYMNEISKEFDEDEKEYIESVQHFVDLGFSPEQAMCLIEDLNEETFNMKMQDALKKSREFDQLVEENQRLKSEIESLKEQIKTLSK